MPSQLSGGIPAIPESLLEYLEKTFPERSAMGPEQTLSYLMYQGGQREVIRFLRARFREQQSTQSELQNVLVQSP